MAVFFGRGADGSWENFEADADCLADLNAQWQERTYVVVDVLRTRLVEPGVRAVTGRVPMLLSDRRFVSIENCTVRIVEEEDA